MAKYRFKTRRFLNDEPTLAAFIIAAVEDGSKVKFERARTQDDYYSNIVFDVGDCSSKVSLDFSI